MAPPQTIPNTQKVGRQPSLQKGQGRRPQGIKKERLQLSTRKSARLARIVFKDTNIELKHPLLSPTSNTPSKESPQAEDRKRKQLPDDETPSFITPPRKRRRASPGPPHTTWEDTSISRNEINPLEYWTKESRWPEEFFESESNMNHLLARKKSSSSLREKRSETSSATPSDQKPRDAKSTPYKRPSYTTVLASRGSFVDESDMGISDGAQTLCERLLEEAQTLPQQSLFRDDLFKKTCRKIQDRNEARIVQDITRLIVPSAETLATFGDAHLELLIEGVNEGWNSAFPFYGPRPQPDYSVGFGRSAFTNDQLKKLEPFVGEITDTVTSYFMATWQMYFPFLTCEVKCGTAALDVADRQNAHSMTIAMRGIVELFRLIGREKELNRDILSFSISHDHESVRIYGHYPVINGNEITYYRHPIRKFDFTEQHGKEKWTAYQFTKNVYDIWVPSHLRRICSVIDKLPTNLDFGVSELEESGLSQGLDSHHLSSQDIASLERVQNQTNRFSSQDVTPHTSVSEQGDRRAPKKSRKRGPPVELPQEERIN